MLPGGDRAASAHRWLARAKGDLALASAPLPPGAFYEDLCFHAQQAAEKAIKAVYVWYGWPFRYVHDLAALLYGLWARGLDTARELEEVAILTSYASEARYPGLAEPVTPEEYDQAVRLAARVVTWAEQIIR